MSEDALKALTNWAAAIGFFGGLLGLMGMGVAVVWRYRADWTDMLYVWSASLGVVCLVAFVGAILLALAMNASEAEQKRKQRAAKRANNVGQTKA